MKETMSKYKRKKMDDDEPYEKGTMRGKVDKMPKRPKWLIRLIEQGANEMKDRPPQLPFTYDPNIVMGIKSNALKQSVPAIMAENHREHCADMVMDKNPFYPVHLTKDGKR